MVFKILKKFEIYEKSYSIKINIIITIILLALIFLPLIIFGYPNWVESSDCYINCK